jgi:hypothetical protein
MEMGLVSANSERIILVTDATGMQEGAVYQMRRRLWWGGQSDGDIGLVEIVAFE